MSALHLGRRHDLRQPHQRRMADGLGDGVVDAAASPRLGGRERLDRRKSRSSRAASCDMLSRRSGSLVADDAGISRCQRTLSESRSRVKAPLAYQRLRAGVLCVNALFCRRCGRCGWISFWRSGLCGMRAFSIGRRCACRSSRSRRRRAAVSETAADLDELGTASPGSTTSCAMRSPRRISNGAWPRLASMTPHLAAIVAVDRARAVEHGDAVVEREARSAAAPAPRSRRAARGSGRSAPARVRPAPGSAGAACRAPPARSRPAAPGDW